MIFKFLIHFSGPTFSAKPASLVHWKAEPAVNFLRPFPHFRHTSDDRIRVSESFSPCLHSSWDFRPLFNHLLGIFCCGWLHFELRFYSPLQLSDSISEIVLKEVSPLSFLSPFICFSLLFSLCRFQFILPQPIDGTFYCGSVRRRCLWRLIFFFYPFSPMNSVVFPRTASLSLPISFLRMALIPCCRWIDVLIWCTRYYFPDDTAIPRS